MCQSKILAIHIDNETIFLTTILILNVIAITTTIIILTRRATDEMAAAISIFFAGTLS